MSDCINRLLYLKQLYFNAGKTILTENYNIFTRYLDYTYAQKEYVALLEQLKEEKSIYYNDKNSVLFNYLVQRLMSDAFKNYSEIFYVLSPFYSVDVIDAIFVPSEKISIYNTINYDDFSICHGYKQADILEIYNYNFSIANEFFEKSMEV